MIKESRYLEIKLVYLQLNAPLFVLAGLNDILINRKLIKQDTISRGKQDLLREVKIYFVLLHIFSPFPIFK